MTYGEPARTSGPIRIRWMRVAALLVVITALAAAFVDRWPTSSSSMASSTSTAAVPAHIRRAETRRALGESDDPPSDGAATAGERGGALGEADGAVPDGTTVFDDGVPGVAKLDPALLGALRQAATEAANDGVQFVVDSGWRSSAYQEHLLQQAVQQYGSEAEARRWVATPDTSAHVSGDAVDVGPTGAAAWLSAHGAAYGLCRVYANESWHFELRPEAITDSCPPMYADPTQDPRMQQ